MKICLSELMPVCGTLGTAGTKWLGILCLLFMSDLVDAYMIIKGAWLSLAVRFLWSLQTCRWGFACRWPETLVFGKKKKKKEKKKKKKSVDISSHDCIAKTVIGRKYWSLQNISQYNLVLLHSWFCCHILCVLLGQLKHCQECILVNT